MQPPSDRSSCRKQKLPTMADNSQRQVGAEHGRQARMPLAEEVLVAADAAAEDGVGQRAALGRDAAGGQHDDQRDAAADGPAQQVADELRGGLKHAGLLVDAEAVKQVADGDQDRDQHPDAVDPAAHRLAHVGLEDGPVGQPACGSWPGLVASMSFTVGFLEAQAASPIDRRGRSPATLPSPPGRETPARSAGRRCGC